MFKARVKVEDFQRIPWEVLMMDCDSDSLSNNFMHVSTITMTIYLSVEFEWVPWGIPVFERMTHGQFACFLP
jgi:hypothetical protein